MQYESAKLKQEASSALQTPVLASSLVPIGVAGALQGDLQRLGLAGVRSRPAGTAVLGSLVSCCMAWFSRVYSSPRRRNRHAGLFVYFFSAAGFIYAVQFLSKGSL
jgi:hypothetical protein